MELEWIVFATLEKASNTASYHHEELEVVPFHQNLEGASRSGAYITLACTRNFNFNPGRQEADRSTCARLRNGDQYLMLFIGVAALIFDSYSRQFI